ncbi:efflux RND transporter permease subunit VmeI [Oceaniserpentilla sp. 4NH20-0058]|uniref:efflux RND transporter permease subunit n=1 Tax=Oceaniserpentilla sp. 4NH20-0058 TaxID=3127660 RepID=UPI003108F68C
MDIAKASIKTPVNTWLLVVICLIGGLIGLGEIGRLEDPSFTIKQALVITAYPGASAEQVEKEVTEPLETAIQQMSQLDQVRSVSKPGVSEITVEMKNTFDGHQLPQIWDELRKRMTDAQNTLPSGVRPIKVVDDFGDVYGLYYALTAPDFTPYQLREFSRIIRRDLLTVPNVTKVSVEGVLKQQITVHMDTSQLANLGISLPDVKSALAYNLRPYGSGRLYVDGQRIRIPIAGGESHVNAIENITIGLPGSTSQIRIRDIASVTFDVVDIPDVLIRHNGESAITLAVSANKEANVVDVGLAVRERINQILSELPAGIILQPIYDQAKVVDEAVGGFITNLILSVAVVIATLCVFMGWRAGVVVGAVLLLTVLGTILVMWLYGLNLERISLGALVIAMGMLVDNAIVVAEGMMLRMQKGYNAIQASSFVVKQTQWPLLGATAIGIAAFSGIGLSNDSTGEFLFSLFAVILISLCLSWVLAITVAPLFGSYFFKVGKEGAGEAFDSKLHQTYKSILLKALKYRGRTVLLLMTVTVISYMSFGFVKQGFFPASNTPIYYVHYWGPQSRDVRETAEYLKQAESFAQAYEEVAAVTTFVGKGATRYTLTYSPEQGNESYGVMIIRTHERDQIPKLIDNLTEELKSNDPDARIYNTRVVFGPGVGAKLEARFIGPDQTVLRQLAHEAEELLKQDGSLRDVRQNWRQKELVFVPQYDEYAAGVAGVTRADFSDAVQFSSNGLNLGKLRDGDYSYDIIAKAQSPNQGKAKTDEVQQLKDAQVWSSYQRNYVPLLQISPSMQVESEGVLIYRRDRIRTISVFAEPGLNETAGSALSRVQPKIDAMVLPDGYRIEWGGEFESSRKAQKSLGGGLPLGFLVMILITIFLFGTVREPLIIWLIVPMAVCGVVAGLLIADLPFGFMSLLGFLSLFGMLIKNAIVLLEEIDIQIETGMDKYEAIVQASLSRLRPVSLAAITTILGMAPLLTDAFFADMSVTIMGGLAFATVLTMIAVPVLYSLFYKVTPKT